MPPLPDHPRLYLTDADAPRLRELRTEGIHAHIWRNVAESAEWCLTQRPRREWIAPVEPDPIYLNLYDRFYAIMADLAITEHLAFAYALSGEDRYGEAARAWVLASCRVWSNEADGHPDGGKAYAVCRMLKGVAVGYDLAFDRFTEEERAEIRRVLTDICRLYATDYFATPDKAGPDFHTHHAIVEFASFGVAALALLDEAPEAREWLEATVAKFRDHLLPMGLAPDGAQVEGATFWASTMQYRLFFMDALRRVTGCDLFGPHREQMKPDLALAGIAARKRPGWNESNQTVVLSPSYGQLDYYAPVLLFLAREYRLPTCQYLALWDESLGAIQRTRYATTNGEQMLFEFGGYDYVWFDPTVPAEPDEERLSYHFPSVNQAYARTSWREGGLLVGAAGRCVVVHAGGRPVLIDLHDPHAELEPCPPFTLTDTGRTVVIACEGEQTVTLHRLGRLELHRRAASPVQWWCHGEPRCDGNSLRWSDGTLLRITKGTLQSVEPGGYHDEKIVGLGKLRCVDPAPTAYPLVTALPEDGELHVEVRTDQA